MFIGSRFRTRTIHAVASSPGLLSYRRLHSSTSIVESVLAVYPTGTSISMKSMISLRFQPKLYAVPIPAWGHPSLIATNTSFS